MIVNLSDGKIIHTVDPVRISGKWSVDYISTTIEEDRQAFERHYSVYLISRYYEKIASGYSLDIGANLGSWTIYLADVAPEVYAYEPHPVNARLLRRTIKDNESNAVVIEAAISNRDGKMTMRSSGMKGMRAARILNLGGSSLSLNGESSCEVSVVSGHTIPSDYKCSSIKVDVEGHESTVLSSLRGIIEDGKPVIFAECTTTSDIASVLDALPEGYVLTKQLAKNNNHLSVYEYRPLL